MKKRGRPPLTTDIFISRAQLIHGDTYDYSKVVYKTAYEKVIITCKKHNDFMTIPNNHLRNKDLGGCPICGTIRMGEKHKSNTENFIEKATKKHKGLYDYSKSIYTKSEKPLIIICGIHGEFRQQASNHLNGQGCPKCKLVKLSESKKYTPEEWILNAKKIHGEKYEYPDLNIDNGNSFITIICRKHGEFRQKIRIHTMGSGCRACGKTLSNGEKKVMMFLRKNNIEFVTQKTIKGLKSKVALRFDFYLPSLKTFIEYDGIQHFKPVNYFGGEKCFSAIKKSDKLKNDYCKNNGIKLLRIAYNEDIEQKLKAAELA